MQHHQRRNRRAAGFTLVELLAAIAIVALLVGMVITFVAKAKASGNKTACEMGQRDIALTLQTYVDSRKEGKWPRERGVRFLLVMVRDDYLRKDDLKKFVCPATDDVTTIPGDDETGSGFKDWDAIDTDCISYAGRDNQQFPLRKDRLSEEILCSDDNWFGGVGRPNHDGLTILAYADGHVGRIETIKYKAELPEKQDWLPVGPESPDEELRKLAID